MAFRWKSVSDKGDILTDSSINEIRKKIDYIANQLIPDKDINLPRWTNNKKITREEILEEIRINIDFIKENNYCRQYSLSECLDKFSTYDSSKFIDKQNNVLLADYLSAEISKKNAQCITLYTTDYESNNGSYVSSHDCNNYGTNCAPDTPGCLSQCNIEA